MLVVVMGPAGPDEESRQSRTCCVFVTWQDLALPAVKYKPFEDSTRCRRSVWLVWCPGGFGSSKGEFLGLYYFKPFRLGDFYSIA